MALKTTLALLVGWLALREFSALPATLAIRRIRRRHYPRIEPQLDELRRLRDRCRRNVSARWAYSRRIRQLAAQGSEVERRRPVMLSMAKLAGALLLCLFTVSFVALLTYTRPPRMKDATTPKDFGMPFREVSFVTDDGVRLAAWHIPGERGAPVVVLCHGLGTCKADLLGTAIFLHERGLHCLMPDFRAHGESGGRFTSFGYLEVRDLRAALGEARRLTDADGSRIGIYGFSMGAAVALMCAPDEPDVLAVVAEAPYDTLARAMGYYGKVLYGAPPRLITAAFWTPYALMFRTKLAAIAPVERIGRIECPLMLVGSEDDPMVAPGTLSALTSAAPRAVVYRGPGAGHAPEDVPLEYLQTIADFLQNALTQAH